MNILSSLVEVTGVPQAQLVESAGLTDVEVSALEGSSTPASAALLDRVARVLGVELEDLLSRQIKSGLTFLFRSSQDMPALLQAPLSPETHKTLGDFARQVRRIAVIYEAQRRLVSSPWWAELEAPALSPDARPEEVGRAWAYHLRRSLGLGPTEPITSMVELVRERLGVEILWAPPKRLEARFDAAVCAGSPSAILVQGRHRSKAWMVRTILAHEVGHLLMDRAWLTSSGRQALLFSPHPRDEHRFPGMSEAFEQLEQRANAFAIHLLAPEQGVREATSGMEPTSAGAIRAVGARFGLGKKATINHLKNVFHFSPVERDAMMELEVQPWRSSVGAEDCLTEAMALEHGRLEQLTLGALAQGQLTPLRARLLLDLPLEASLPPAEGLPEALRAPLVSPERLVLGAVMRYLIARYGVDAGLAPLQPRPVVDGWEVEVVGDEAPSDRVLLHLPRDLSRVEERELARG